MGKATVTAQSSLSNNYCIRVTAARANQNAQRPFFNTEIILNSYRNTRGSLEERDKQWDNPNWASITRYTGFTFCDINIMYAIQQ